MRVPQLGKGTGDGSLDDPKVSGALRQLPLCRAVEEYVRWCLARESPPRVQELAVFLGCSRRRLELQLYALTGQLPAKSLKREQIRIAAHLLATTGLSITQIAYRAGLGTRRTFYRSFRAGMGFTPTGYRRYLQEERLGVDRNNLAALAIHQAAGVMADKKIAGQIQKMAAKSIGKEAQKFLGAKSVKTGPR